MNEGRGEERWPGVAKGGREVIGSGRWILSLGLVRTSTSVKKSVEIFV